MLGPLTILHHIHFHIAGEETSWKQIGGYGGKRHHTEGRRKDKRGEEVMPESAHERGFKVQVSSSESTRWESATAPCGEVTKPHFHPLEEMRYE
jgi:hypothetical protein